MQPALPAAGVTGPGPGWADARRAGWLAAAAAARPGPGRAAAVQEMAVPRAGRAGSYGAGIATPVVSQVLPLQTLPEPAELK